MLIAGDHISDKAFFKSVLEPFYVQSRLLIISLRFKVLRLQRLWLKSRYYVISFGIFGVNHQEWSEDLLKWSWVRRFLGFFYVLEFLVPRWFRVFPNYGERLKFVTQYYPFDCKKKISLISIKSKYRNVKRKQGYREV